MHPQDGGDVCTGNILRDLHGGIPRYNTLQGGCMQPCWQPVHQHEYSTGTSCSSAGTMCVCIPPSCCCACQGCAVCGHTLCYIMYILHPICPHTVCEMAGMTWMRACTGHPQDLHGAIPRYIMACREDVCAYVQPSWPIPWHVLCVPTPCAMLCLSLIHI